MIAVISMLFLLLFFNIAYSLRCLFKNNSDSFLNIYFFLNVLTAFYVMIPSISSLILTRSLTGVSVDIVYNSAFYAIYFNAILVLFTLLWSSFVNTSYLPKLKVINNGKIKLAFNSICLIVASYAIFVLVLNVYDVISIFGDRAKQSALNEFFQLKYKINLALYVTIIFSSCLSLCFNNRRYLFYLTPYVLFDVLLMGKLYLYMVLVSFCIISAILDRKINLKLISGIVIILLASVVFRTVLRSGEFQYVYLLQVLSEFTNTWEVTYLVQVASDAQDFTETLIYSLFRILPSPYYYVFFGEYHSYTQISSSVNSLDYGLAGNIIAEAFAFKDNLVLAIYPFLFFFFFSLVGFLNKSKSILFRIIYILYAIYLLPIYRFGFFEFALYPIYLFLFLGLPLWVANFIIKKDV
ncbi:membrane hypothetical protein [Vibrio chagasii]|nr:membrane hypothetical protein [Vibrio chagasii]CAH6896641.1 membrane hypothetical protein [Vibrio chagasii]